MVDPSTYPRTQRRDEARPASWSATCRASTPPRFTPLLADAARPCRHQPGDRWYVDDTHVKIASRRTYLYRAVDQHGRVIDVLTSTPVPAATRRLPAGSSTGRRRMGAGVWAPPGRGHYRQNPGLPADPRRAAPEACHSGAENAATSDFAALRDISRNGPIRNVSSGNRAVRGPIRRPTPRTPRRTGDLAVCPLRRISPGHRPRTTSGIPQAQAGTGAVRHASIKVTSSFTRSDRALTARFTTRMR